MKQPKKALPSISGTACIITGDLFDTVHAKTAHGLVRGTDRFEITGLIDTICAGRDAGEVLDGKNRNIPVTETLEQLIAQTGIVPDYAIIGMATKGGILPQSLYPTILEVLKRGIDVINGLHQPITSIPELNQAAEENGVHIYDIRRSKSFEELHFWKGKLKDIEAMKIAVLGTDCGLGKRTTARMVTQALQEAGVKAAMVYTGQTGWLQGIEHGFIFDATPNDFIPGELEHAIYSCYTELSPEVILIEGQAGLRNPGGPCGSEFIISATIDGVILQHHPTRKHFLHLEYYPAYVPDPIDEIGLIRHLGAPTWALTLNTKGLSAEERMEQKARLAARTDIPVICPLEDGVEQVVQMIKSKLPARV